MKTLPTYAVDLIKELDASTPARCIRSGESVEDAHRYAGKRELVESLVLRVKASITNDPSQPIVRSP